ncbi:MAG: hypothetical protein A4S09_05445 [Proteobacteria bacterium SG_bin7]|nr:MAG: hypothetical protein A4S09_05445 [Proteobacteria bacterium SG_bin7]
MNWETEKVFHDGDSFFKSVLESIDGAKNSVRLEYYIFSEGVLAYRFLRAIQNAVARGVRVDLGLDAIGTLRMSTSFFNEIVASGTKFRIYHPLPRIFFLFTSKFWRRLFRINQRNHRKICLVDERILFVGGMNVDDWHLIEVKGKEAWRDSGVCVTSKDLSILTRNLEVVWHKKKKETDFGEIKLPILLNDGRFRRRRLNRTFISRIKSSNRRVWITSPYFTPPARLLLALIDSGRRGVDTRLLLPSRADHFFSRPMNGLFYPMLLSSGVKIYEYTMTTLHAKTAVLDNWVLVGTSNRNHRSFFYDLEVDVILSYPDSIREMEKQFIEDLRFSKAVNLKKWNERHWIYRIFEKILWLVHKWT